jgi:hypothetical protein
MAFAEDFEFSDRFRQHLCEIAKNVFRPQVAPQMDDWQRNTDFLLSVDVPHRDGLIRISARCRRRKYIGRYGAKDFTVRYRRPSGVATEMVKMLNGWGDLFVYGFEAADGSDRLFPYFVGNTQLLRQSIRDGCGPWAIRTNKDGSSSMAVFRLMDMPLGFVLYSEGITIDDEDIWFQCPGCYTRRGMPLDDRGQAGDGFERRCLFCGHEWRSARSGHLFKPGASALPPNRLGIESN